jgi:hypothetical protein
LKEKKLRVLLAEGSSGRVAAALRVLYPEEQGIGPVLCQRLQRRMAVLNQDTGSRGRLELRIHAQFWSPRDASSFSQWLDTVEAGLRTGPAAVESRVPEAFTKG